MSNKIKVSQTPIVESSFPYMLNRVESTAAYEPPQWEFLAKIGKEECYVSIDGPQDLAEELATYLCEQAKLFAQRLRR